VIGLIRGTVVLVEGSTVLVDTGGVGYEVLVPDSAIGRLVPGSEAILFTRHIIREDANFLCGFFDREDRSVFDLLMEVKGCGPKVCLALIGQVSSNGVISAIVTADAKFLCRATGVGQRLAERIILELRTKVESGRGAAVAIAAAMVPASPDRDLVDALTVLGYRRQEIDLVLPKLDAETAGDARLKQALQLLRKK
jgi:holliday junction DNA helicase RuvA